LINKIDLVSKEDKEKVLALVRYAIMNYFDK
jgi:hypothetical protein